jgi:hypothetical protein
VVEAKKEEIAGGYGQCIAEMVAARIFNQNYLDRIEKILGVLFDIVRE